MSLAAWVVFTLGLSLWFACVAARDLANFRPVSNDEVELIEVGYKLATRGVLGSDMYVGFFGADDHHLWTLPVQHVLDAVSFRIFGAGVAQARWVSLIAALCVVWSVGWLVRRWYGAAAALLSELLLTFWRSDLTAGPTGIPLLDVARVARYDVLALAFIWLAILALDLTLMRPGRVGAVLAGASAGIAGLTQFFGVFALPLLIVSRSRNWRNRLREVGWMVAAAALVFGAWLVYLARYAGDLAGQLTVYGQRGDFLRPTFFLENIASEPDRYAHILLESLPADLTGAGAAAYQASTWLLLVGTWVAVAYLVMRSVRARRDTARVGDTLLLSTLLVFGGLLLVLDQTKTPLYAILIVPSLCGAISATLAGLLAWAWRRVSTVWQQPGFIRPVGGAAVCAVTLALVALVLVEGMRVYGVDRAEAEQVSPYLAVGQRIDDTLAPGGVVLGPERWWWALHDHPYISLRSVWFQWTALAAAPPEPDLLALINRSRPDSVVVNNNARNDLQAFPVKLQDQFWSFIRRCTTLVAEIDDPTYFDTQVYRVIECS